MQVLVTSWALLLVLTRGPHCARYFATLGDFEIEDTLQPVVSAEACFDDLLIPFDHPGRKPSDTCRPRDSGGSRAVW